MQDIKYNLSSTVHFCLKYSPGTVAVKLAVEIINGASMPLMVLVVAAFINNAVSFVYGGLEA